MRRRPAVESFNASTRMIAEACQASAARHVLLSIVNYDLPDVQGYGYFAARAEQERVARALSPQLILVRSTQWFEFAGQNQQRMQVGPLSIVPAMRIQPVALQAVAEVVAAEALADNPRCLVQIAGSEVMTLQELTRATCPAKPRPDEVRIPTRYGRALTQGALLPPDGVVVAGPLPPRVDAPPQPQPVGELLT